MTTASASAPASPLAACRGDQPLTEPCLDPGDTLCGGEECWHCMVRRLHPIVSNGVTRLTRVLCMHRTPGPWLAGYNGSAWEPMWPSNGVGSLDLLARGKGARQPWLAEASKHKHEKSETRTLQCGSVDYCVLCTVYCVPLPGR